MLNKTIIQGRLTRDPEIRRTGSGVPVASFRIAWSEKYKESEQKLFLSCVAWRSTAEFASRFFRRGQQVIAEGKLTTRQWKDKDGSNRETTELVVDQLYFCGPKEAAADHSGSHKLSEAVPYGAVDHSRPAPMQMSESEYALLDDTCDDFPFDGGLSFP